MSHAELVPLRPSASTKNASAINLAMIANQEIRCPSIAERRQSETLDKALAGSKRSFVRDTSFEDEIVAASPPRKNLPQSARFGSNSKSSKLDQQQLQLIPDQRITNKVQQKEQLRFTYESKATPLPPIDCASTGSMLAQSQSITLQSMNFQTMNLCSKKNSIQMQMKDITPMKTLIQEPLSCQATPLASRSRLEEQHQTGSSLISKNGLPPKHHMTASTTSIQQQLQLQLHPSTLKDRLLQLNDLDNHSATPGPHMPSLKPSFLGNIAAVANAKPTRSKKKRRKRQHSQLEVQLNEDSEYQSQQINNQNLAHLNSQGPLLTVEENDNETLPQMMLVQQQTSTSSYRRSSQKAPHKKSAGSQARKNKQRISSINTRQSQQQSAAGKNRVFNLIVSNKAEGSLKPLPQASVLGPQQQQSVILSGKQFGLSTQVNGRTNAPHSQQISQIESANQKRVQSTAPRLFSYKPQINDIGKSPFLQPIVSQKQIKQPEKVGLMPGLGHHGKQVMASMNKHQPPLMKQQQHQQALVNSRLTHSSQQQQILTVVTAPLPQFLAKKHENQVQQQQQMQSYSAVSSALDKLQQKSSTLGRGMVGNMSQSPKQSSPSQQLSLLSASIQGQMVNPYLTSTESKKNLISNGQGSGCNSQEAQHPATAIGGVATTIDSYSLYNDTVLNSGVAKTRELPGFAQTLPASLVQQREQQVMSNGQPQGSQTNKKSSPVVSYLMHLHQNVHTQKRPQNEPLQHQGHHQQASQNTLHRSSSNFIKNSHGVRQTDNKQQQQVQDKSGTSHHFLMMDNNSGVYDTGNYGTMYSKKPSMMVLGQSPSNQRILNNSNGSAEGGVAKIGASGPRQNGHQVMRLNQQVYATNGGGADGQNKQGPVLVMGQPGNVGLQDYRQNLAQLVQSYNNSILGQPVQAGPNSYKTMFESLSKSPPQNFEKYMHQMIEDDQGIDERYDGNQSGDSCGEDGGYDENDEFSSPRAAKPRPLDQSFMPEKGKKYFSVTIGYPAMRRALRAQGWIEVKCYKRLQQIAGYTSSPGTRCGNIGLESTVNRQFDNNLDLKFVLSAQDANHQNLKPGCLMNQNRGEGNLTCKSGLKESLFRSYHQMANWYPMEHCDPKGLGPEAFFPRQHVTNTAEALQEFQRDYVITEAENYLRRFIKKLKDFKEKAAKMAAKPAMPLSRIQTPLNPTRTPSKARNSTKKKPSNSHLTDLSPPTKESDKAPQASEEIQSDHKSPYQDDLTLSKPYSLQDLGFLKEKLLICCNIARKRMKDVDGDLDKKKGIRTDRTTRGTILIEERSFLLRSPKTISQAYLKYISKEEWYQKAVNRFPQFKKDKSLPAQQQLTTMCDKIALTCQEMIDQLREQYPQTDMNGTSNLWIVKPGGLSRGRKIRLFKDFYKILEYAEVDSAAGRLASTSNPSGPNTQYYMNHTKPASEEQQAYTKKTWVIQKYIENPMLILNRKFDIRVWVVIPSWNPLRIYMFNECYLRFSCNDYDPRCPENLFSHLTNNAVVKKCIERPDNQRALNKIPGNMWSLDQFKEYLGGKSLKHGLSTKKLEREVNSSQSASRQKSANSTANFQQPSEAPEFVKGEGAAEGRSEFLEAGTKIWDTEWYPQAKEIIVQSILSAWDKIEWRKGGIGVYGFDLFPDVNGKLWLLEINKCPTMEYSTDVTRKLVPMFLDQMTELIIDTQKHDHPVVGNLEQVFSVPKLRDLTEYQQTNKPLVVEAKGLDHINNQNYLSALHRNKKQTNANPPGHKGHYKHNY